MAMIAFHQDIEIIPEKRDFSVRLRYKTNDTENNQLLNENLVRHIAEYGLRIKGKPSRSAGFQLEINTRNDEKIYASRPFSNRNILLYDGSGELSYRPKQQLELALKCELKTAEDTAPDPVTRARSLFWIPRISYAFRGRGNVRAEIELGEVRSEPDNRTLPYEMLGGDQPGQTLRWNILVTYHVSGHVMATLNYRARQEPWRKGLYQTGQVEVRAFF
jgi:hypothetical protein